jgi:(1->4)-alpha-D-glucan 1-alpha-D-glucosylmutase
MTAMRATARLQFHRDFPMDRALELVPYFARLGVSHLYASPLLKARPGSTHGYDIVDHNTINPELGGEAALHALVAELRRHDMGLILDIVPNHMGVGGADNAWWLDVLEWGRASPYATYFDIDWDPSDPTLRGKLLAPFLGAPYGTALDGGDIVLKFDASDGRFFASVYDAHRFPIAPQDYPTLLRAAGGALDPLAEPFIGAANLQARPRVEAARAALIEAAAANQGAIQAILDWFAPQQPVGRQRLHLLLERQNFRLAWWRAASDEINWRRFFDINGLAGMRQEESEVFDATHAKILGLYADGLIDGVRIDHVDGLADPRGYCRKLRRQLQTAHARRPEPLQAAPPILWVEKILFSHERLAADWLTDGTTGYDFMNEASAVLHDPAGEAPITELWSSTTGRPAAFDVEQVAARRQILRQALSSELWATSAAFRRVLSRNLATRDWTLTRIRRALEEILVHFHTYRIYAGPSGASESDLRAMAWAMAGARRTTRSADEGLLGILEAVILGQDMRRVPPGGQRRSRLRAMIRFQQLSAPTAAKSVEDTAFYRYGRLLSRNEVGSEPSQWALAPSAFHGQARYRAKRLPRALLATATHDHKRGEDTRARLAVLSEIPGPWAEAVARWTRLNAPLKREIDGHAAPDAADELMLYQMLVAAWPLDLAIDDPAGLDVYRERVSGWLEKALREAKRYSEWAAPNEPYESACQTFLAACLDAGRSAPVLREIAQFAERIAVPGAVNSLSQTLLRLTVPGIPDLYQGTEFWDFSLVDPDNRRPVDFAARQQALAQESTPADLLASWRDGRIKQALIAAALDLRRRRPHLFAHGDYLPLEVEGPAADHVLAFARRDAQATVVVIAPRLMAGMLAEADVPLAPAAAWAGTTVVLPRHTSSHKFTDLLARGRPLAGSRLNLADILRMPVALLEAS